MGLLGSLQIGRTGLLASQTALQVAGQNLANLSTEGYRRQTISLSPERSQEIGQGIFIGRGVRVQSITRVIDEALEARLRGAVSDQSSSQVRQQLLGRIEAIENEFSGSDLSSQLGAFFNAFSEIVNNPQDVSLRTLLVEQSSSLAGFIRDLNSGLGEVQFQTIEQIDQTVASVNDLLTRIATIDNQVAVQSRGAAGGAPGLRDQRDVLLSELSKFIDISTVEQPSGSIDVFVGNLPIILNGTSRGVELLKESVNGQTVTKVVISADKSPLDITSGELGALIQFKENDIQDAIDDLDAVAGQLIYQVNRLQSQGQGLDLLDGVTGAQAITDATVALNDTATGLSIPPTHGSFQLHVVQKSTGQVVTTTINIDLDGINPASDTTLTSLAASIDAAANIGSAVTPDGRLQITADSGDFAVSFSDDTSGVLASLGINTFFAGQGSFDISRVPRGRTPATTPTRWRSPRCATSR
jgi:flagellar hook-associated protein 1